MPDICRFYGIIISIFYNDHNPPHFHVTYNEFNAKVVIQNLKVIEGELPSRVKYMVMEWALVHRKELNENWRLAVAGKPLRKIKPLE